MKRCKDWDHEISQFLEISNRLKTCSTRFPGVQSASLYPELPQQVLKVNSCSSTEFSLCRGIWQTPLLLLFNHWQMFLASVDLSLKHSTGNSWGFSGDSDSKESTCNVGNLGFIPGLGRSPEEGMATYSSILVWSIPMDWGAWQVAVHWVTEGWTRLSKHTLTHLKCLFLAHIKPETHFPDYIIVFF